MLGLCACGRRPRVHNDQVARDGIERRKSIGQTFSAYPAPRATRSDSPQVDLQLPLVGSLDGSTPSAATSAAGAARPHGTSRQAGNLDGPGQERLRVQAHASTRRAAPTSRNSRITASSRRPIRRGPRGGQVRDEREEARGWRRTPRQRSAGLGLGVQCMPVLAHLCQSVGCAPCAAGHDRSMFSARSVFERESAGRRPARDAHSRFSPPKTTSNKKNREGRIRACTTPRSHRRTNTMRCWRCVRACGSTCAGSGGTRVYAHGAKRTTRNRIK